MISYLILTALVFLGVFCGLAAGRMAEEELKPGRSYLVWMRNIIFTVILLTFLYLNTSVIFFLTVPVLVILFSFSRKRESFYYAILAIMMFLSYIYNGFSMIAPLIFLYGFPLGSIYLYENPKEKLKKNVVGLLWHYAWFVVLSVILVLVSFVFQNSF